jgi:hypothetical protein
MIIAYRWIKSAIKSSTSQFHIDCCVVLLELFEQKHGKDNEFYKELYSILINQQVKIDIEV